LDVEASFGTVCVVLELEMCWRWISDGVRALLELRSGVGSGGLSWIEVGLRLEAGLVWDVGLVLEVRVVFKLGWCWRYASDEGRALL